MSSSPSQEPQSTSPTTHKIGIILCSTRQPRVCPQIGTFVTQLITPLLPPASSPTAATLSMIDLLAINLPLFNEPSIPSQIHSASLYQQPHTQAWSKLISEHSAFIFITPQYNWGYPAAVKNAIDYLFNEWKGKPALIVSYGGHGGGHAAKQLRVVLEGGLGMKVTRAMPALSFPGRQALIAATRGEDMQLGDGEKEVWVEEGKEIQKGFEELLGLLEKNVGVGAA